ncbi:hypothetical protein PYCCODRAFT_1000119 [Trametes coccinea BRFM310]|uniref:Uncharacterized protein n=1 Tax=Trametes coccinea (strain BRFM310) TaxID=1353009 RepID=A0A1Y2ID90_TRAC3|nr:hypothetical protein PYCCODRAFT_1000119 [Trametes coccinea BRFM310]
MSDGYDWCTRVALCVHLAYYGPDCEDDMRVTTGMPCFDCRFSAHCLITQHVSMSPSSRMDLSIPEPPMHLSSECSNSGTVQSRVLSRFSTAPPIPEIHSIESFGPSVKSFGPTTSMTHTIRTHHSIFTPCTSSLQPCVTSKNWNKSLSLSSTHGPVSQSVCWTCARRGPISRISSSCHIQEYWPRTSTHLSRHVPPCSHSCKCIHSSFTSCCRCFPRWASLPGVGTPAAPTFSLRQLWIHRLVPNTPIVALAIALMQLPRTSNPSPPRR